MKNLLLFLSFIAIISSCTNAKSEQDALKAEIAAQVEADSLKNIIAEQQVVIDEENESAEVSSGQSSDVAVASSVPASTTPAKKKWSNKQKGVVIGAASGAVVGAVVSKKRVKGAIIGTAVGGGVGLGAGAILDKKQNN